MAAKLSCGNYGERNDALPAVPREQFRLLCHNLQMIHDAGFVPRSGINLGDFDSEDLVGLAFASTYRAYVKS
jgi:hypothetical protein